MTCLAALAVCALPIAGPDTCHFGTLSAPGTNVRIEPADEAFARVVIRNELAYRLNPTCDLTLFGVTVVVHYDPGAGREIDRFRVAVPPGFRAEPAELLVEDETGATVVIYLEGENS